MFNLFGKKKEEDAPSSAQGEEEGDEDEKKTKIEASPSSSPEVGKLSIEVDRMKASVESFTEVRKSFTERMTQLSEQIGELRAMIMDRDKTIREVELKSMKAADLVETVQPEKYMTDIQKLEAKFEALKANLEGNEAIMDRVMEELKEARKKIDFFRGVEEIVKLSEEIKKDLIDIKKVEANIHINTDKVETFYSEIRRKYKDLDGFTDTIQELKVQGEQNAKDIDYLKLKSSELAEKDDLEKLMQKVQRYTDTLKDLNKNSSLTKDVAQLKTILEGIK